MLSNIALWIDERLHTSKLFVSTAGHTVPASAGSWFYIFGSGTLLCFIIQIVTGNCSPSCTCPRPTRRIPDWNI